jgi:methyl-accepting chemotaxis protein
LNIGVVDAREDEISKNLQEVSGMVGNMKAMATDLGSKIDNQNEQIERMNEKVFKLHFFLPLASRLLPPGVL